MAIQHIALEPGEHAVELREGGILISQGEHEWVDHAVMRTVKRCSCGVFKHQNGDGGYWYSMMQEG